MLITVIVQLLVLTTVLLFNVFCQLVFAVVSLVTQTASIGFVFEVSSSVVIAVSNCCEIFLADVTDIWLLFGVDSSVDLEISFLIELSIAFDHLSTLWAFSFPVANEDLLLLSFGFLYLFSGFKRMIFWLSRM